LIVDEETKSTLSGITLRSADAEVHGGGLAGAIGGLERVEIEFQIVGVREDDAGGGSYGVAIRFVHKDERVSSDEEEARETIARGKGDVGAAMRK
jgi:hypothetical protein